LYAQSTKIKKTITDLASMWDTYINTEIHHLHVSESFEAMCTTSATA